MPYHHGDLRRALLDTALDAVAEQVRPRSACATSRAGPASRTPPPHTTSGTRPGCSPRWPPRDGRSWPTPSPRPASEKQSFAELGVTYVLFATAHPAHFAVMRAPGLIRSDDPELVAAQQSAGEQLQAGASSHDRGATPETATTALAGWALVHGLSALLVEGMVRPEPGTDVATLARSVIARLRPGG